MLPAMKSVNGSVLPSLFLDDWPVDRMVRNLNGQTNGNASQKHFPLDVEEHSDRYVIKMEVAGVCREHIELCCEDNVLSIKVERSKPSSEEGVKHLLRGRWYGVSTRTVSLPEAASGEEIEAHLKDGVLTIEVKKQPEKQPRKIEIKDMN